MWIIAIAWLYVALMMALAEATSPVGSVLGAIISFFMYGVGPLAIVMYIVATPARLKAKRAAEAEAWEAEKAAMAKRAQEIEQASTAQADAGSLSSSDAVTSERKEP